jgi:DNA polymerase-1
MLKPSRSGNESILWGVDDIKKEFSVKRPEQVIDILALMGDAADNIPGAPGVGPKTAMKLISEYGSIEELFKNTDKLKGKLKEIIENNREQIEMSKKLATIEQNVPVELNETALELEVPDPAKLKVLFDELEFKTVATRILSEIDKSEKPRAQQQSPAPQKDSLQGSLFEDEAVAPVTEKTSIESVEHTYIQLKNNSDIEEFVKKVNALKEFCFDSETTSINPLDAELVALTFSWEKGTGYLIHFPESQKETRVMLEIVRSVFENPVTLKIGQNMKFDIQVLANYGIEVKGPLFDTMIAHYLLEPDMRHNMNLLSEAYLGYSPVHIESLIGEKGNSQKNMRSVPVDKLIEYAVEDADVTYQLKKVFEPRIESERLSDLAHDIEMPLISVLATMERNGVILNLADLKAITINLREDILSLEKEIYTLAGTEFNISSPKQLGDILFIRLKLDE